MAIPSPFHYVPALFDVWIWRPADPPAVPAWQYVGRMTSQQLELGAARPTGDGAAYFLRPTGLAAPLEGPSA